MKSGEAKLFMGILIGALILVAVAVYPTIIQKGPQRSPVPPERPAPAQATLENLVPKGSHVRGNPSAPYTLVEFGDYQCPNCASSAEFTTKLIDQHKDRIRFVFHHCQVAPAHTNEPMLAHAAELAGEQGKFWQMHDKIFANYTMFEGAAPSEVVENLTRMAGEIGIDVLRFRQGMANSEDDAFERDMRLAKSLNVNLTPTFFAVPPRGKVIEVSGKTAIEGWANKTKFE